MATLTGIGMAKDYLTVNFLDLSTHCFVLLISYRNSKQPDICFLAVRLNLWSYTESKYDATRATAPSAATASLPANSNSRRPAVRRWVACSSRDATHPEAFDR